MVVYPFLSLCSQFPLNHKLLSFLLYPYSCHILLLLFFLYSPFLLSMEPKKILRTQRQEVPFSSQARRATKEQPKKTPPLSYFYYEIKKNVNQAIKIAKEAIKGAKKQFDKIKEEEDKDGGVTLQTLKENVLIWEKE